MSDPPKIDYAAHARQASKEMFEECKRKGLVIPADDGKWEWSLEMQALIGHKPTANAIKEWWFRE